MRSGPPVTVDDGTAVAEVLSSDHEGACKDAVAAVVNGRLVDISYKLFGNAEIEPVSKGDPRALGVLRHSTSHVMAAAVKRMFPDAKFAIGPDIEDGFYYDFDLSRTLSNDDLGAIEKEMARVAKKNHRFERSEMSRADAIREMKAAGQEYKVELLEEIEDDIVSFYACGEFTDLCVGPHLKNTSQIRHFRLLSVAGAYWRGDENRKMLQRIYGTAFFSREDLDDHLRKLEEAEKRDHRKLGVALDLFHMDGEVGPGLPLWHPKGALVRKIMEDFWRDEHLKGGYELVITPHIARYALWEKSGHTEFFAENMYSPMEVDNNKYLVKPMNCPLHLLIYKSRMRSYRDLPIRWAELGTVYRYEKSGVLHGLNRVRGFTQDDAHLIFREGQMDEEIERVISFCVRMLRSFGFTDYAIYLSTMPEEHIGEDAAWERATVALRRGLEKVGLPFEEDEGAGAFYGPKIDIKIKDALGREWQCSTIQLDFNEPERFDITYIGEDGGQHRPVMIHRALLGSIERFFGVMLEHYGGLFPLWLAPMQATVLPVTSAQDEYAEEVRRDLQERGIRAESDLGRGKIGHKIRDATMEKIPYMLVVGPKEVESGTVSVRHVKDGDMGARSLDDFIAEVEDLVENRSTWDERG